MRWLYARNQFAVKLGLENPRRLLAALGNPERGRDFLHVAGTNGKGSVCANLAALLPASGMRRVGLYTSPHLVSFRERIRVDGEPVPALWVAEWLGRNVDLLENLNVTYFECVTAMALEYFRERDCEAVVLETGLGGRLDATNAVTPRVTAITAISLDHTQILGETLEAIWSEKLGIVKPGVPLIVDEGRPALARLAEERAAAAGAPFLNLAAALAPAPGGFVLRGRRGEYALPGDLRPEGYQIRNAALSWLALEAFLDGAPDLDALLPSLRTARLPGRMQWLAARSEASRCGRGEGLLPAVLDGAHNPAGMEALCAHLRNLPGKKRFFFAVMRDKDAPTLVRSLRAVSEDIVFLDLRRAFPRAVGFEELRATLPSEEVRGLRAAAIAWSEIHPLLLPESGADLAVFCGSLYLLGEVIPVLLPHYRGLEEFARLAAEDGISGS